MLSTLILKYLPYTHKGFIDGPTLRQTSSTPFYDMVPAMASCRFAEAEKFFEMPDQLKQQIFGKL